MEAICGRNQTMAATKVFNIVVIGIGRAGRVRIQDLKEAETSGFGLKLAGFVSRRSLELDGVRQMPLDEALQSPDVDGVVVCTEPSLHEETIMNALKHNKHVLVEYPIASTPDKARELYSLADQKGLVLHEENIGLLTAAYTKLKQKVDSSCALKSEETKLRGSYNGWVEDFFRSGLPFITNISIIQTVLTVFGDVKGVAASLQSTDDGYVATGDVQTSNGAIIKIISERYKERVPRMKTLKFVFEDGSVFDTEVDRPTHTVTPIQTDPGQLKKKAEMQGIFMQDLKLFAEKLQGQRSRSEGADLAVKSLEVALQLNQFIADHNRQ